MCIFNQLSTSADRLLRLLKIFLERKNEDVIFLNLKAQQGYLNALMAACCSCRTRSCSTIASRSRFNFIS